MAVITVDGRDITIGDDEQLNCIQAAARAGVEIPYYCWHPGLTVVASCRMCLIETGSKDEQSHVRMEPKLVPACQTPAKEGTVIVTDSEKVKANQRFVMESLLLDHPVDCPICDQAGECWLQDYYFKYGERERRADIRSFKSRRKDVGPNVTLFIDRCIMCSRCVRFTREISGTGELAVVQRGNHAEIDIFDGQPLDNKLAGNVVDLCPVGALCSKDFLYKQRAWFLKTHSSICTRCSTGCSIVVDENKDTIYRLRPRHNPHVNDWWMCDIGRYGFHYVHSPERLRSVSRREDGMLKETSWEEAIPAVREALTHAAQTYGPDAVAGVLSPFLTCEEAYLLARFLKTLAPNTTLALGPVPTVDRDESFPNGFTIHAERCPNRRGVAEILRHFQGEVLGFASLRDRVSMGQVKAIYFTGGYPEPWMTPEQAEPLEALELLVVQDILPSPVSQLADFLLPGCSFAEKDGSYVNQQGLLQTTRRAIRPRDGSQVDGQILSALLGESGLYRAEDVRRELARTIPYFAPAANEIPEWGVALEKAEAPPRKVLSTLPGTIFQPIPDPRAPGTPHPGR